MDCVCLFVSIGPGDAWTCMEDYILVRWDIDSYSRVHV
jgi:hypothetical protein